MINLEEHFGLVKSVINKYLKHSTEDFDDLYQVGCMGLMEAVMRYDESKGVKFSSYAVPYIRFTITKYVRGTSIIKISKDDYNPNLITNQMRSLDAPITMPDGNVMNYSELLGYEDGELEVVPLKQAITAALQYALSRSTRCDATKSHSIIIDYIEGLKDGISLDQKMLARKYQCTQAAVSRIIAKYMIVIQQQLIKQGYGEGRI